MIRIRLLTEHLLLGNGRVTLRESKQQLINLGYPQEVATEWIRRYGKRAYQLAKWYMDFIDIHDPQTLKQKMDKQILSSGYSIKWMIAILFDTRMADFFQFRSNSIIYQRRTISNQFDQVCLLQSQNRI